MKKFSILEQIKRKGNITMNKTKLSALVAALAISVSAVNLPMLYENGMHVYAEETGTETDTETETDTAPETDTETDTTPETDTETDPETDTAPETDTDTETETEPAFPVADADGDGLFDISTLDDLLWFRDYVNTTDPTAGAELMSDITYNEGTFKYVNGEILYNGAKISTVNEPLHWTPIGSEEIPYCGTFDGCGFSISGLYISDTDETTGRAKGLFGSVGTEGMISNLGLTDSYIYGAYAVGGICGSNYGAIACCDTSAIVRSYEGASSNGYSFGYAGGICGKNEGTIRESGNTGTVFGGIMIGGICGSSRETVGCTNAGTVIGIDMVGGICGQNSAELVSCSNYGDVSGETNVAGISGSAVAGIEGCLNYGNISGSSAVAGICGTQAAYSVISDCCNSYAEITSSYNQAAGICAVSNGLVKNSFNLGTVQSEGDIVGGICGTVGMNGAVQNCFNDGVISGNEKIGGICGVTELNSRLENCFNLGAVTAATPVVGAICGANSGAKATVSGCVYNLDTSLCEGGIGLDESTVESAVKALTTYEMLGVSARFYMDNFDFEYTWGIRTEVSGDGDIIAYYPYLLSFGHAYAIGVQTEFRHGTTLGGGISIVDANDASKVLKIYSDTLVGAMPSIDPAVLLCADYNTDGVVNTDDAVLILKDYANAMLDAKG